MTLLQHRCVRHSRRTRRSTDLLQVDLQLLDTLNVQSLPDALLKRRGGGANAPANPQTLWHPQLVQVNDVLPVPAHLFTQRSDWKFSPEAEPEHCELVPSAEPEHLSTSAETARVQEGEDVEAEDSGQQAAEVCSLQGQSSAHADTQEPELLHSTAENRVVQHGLPLTVGPPEELQRHCCDPHSTQQKAFPAETHPLCHELSPLFKHLRSKTHENFMNS